MANVFLITYDAQAATEALRNKVLSALAETDAAIQLSETSFAAVFSGNATQLWEKMSHYIGKKGLVYVFQLSADWSGHGDDSVKEWMSKHLS